MLLYPQVEEDCIIKLHYMSWDTETLKDKYFFPEYSVQPLLFIHVLSLRTLMNI